MRKKKLTKLVMIKNKCLLPALSANDHARNDWIIDSGGTQHMTFEREWFTAYKSIVARKLYMGDDTILKAIGKGSIKATMQVGGKMLLTTITQDLHVLKMKNSLISVANSFRRA
jgi:hypothetical protein